MTDELTTSMVRIRRAAIGAAIGATGIVGAALDPFATRFGESLMRFASFGSGGDVDHLRLGTVVAGGIEVQDWLDQLRDAYGLDVSNALLAESLALRLGLDRTSLALTEGRTSSVPALEFGFLGRKASMTIFEALGSAGVSKETLEAYDTLLGRLGLREIDEFSVVMSDPRAEPQFRVRLAAPVSAAVRGAFAGRLDHAMEMLGISPPQRRYLGAMVEALAPRPENALDVTVALSRTKLHPWLRVAYPDVPVRFLLKFLTQFSKAAHIGTRVGALAAAAGVGDADIVSRIELIGWNGEPPKVSFELHAGPPDVATA